MPNNDQTLAGVFTDIANAIREKTGSQEPLRPLDFATSISEIEGGLTGEETLLLNADGSFNWTVDSQGLYVGTEDNPHKVLVTAYSSSSNLFSGVEYVSSYAFVKDLTFVVKIPQGLKGFALPPKRSSH